MNKADLHRVLAQVDRIQANQDASMPRNLETLEQYIGLSAQFHTMAEEPWSLRARIEDEDFCRWVLLCATHGVDSMIGRLTQHLIDYGEDPEEEEADAAAPDHV